VDGFFLEVHEDPDRGLSDGPNMLVLETVPALLETVQRIRAAARMP
jgi:2-dehydro-3-deoxyphosphooctonate aldolase (KDO 8-P synthase)